MKILIDLQCLQTPSKYRGIGRYARELTLALIKHTNLEVYLLINGSLESSANEILSYFSHCCQRSHFRYFYSEGNLSFQNYGSTQYWDAEELYSRAVRQSNVDILLVPSLFEGYADPFILPPLGELRKYISIISIVHDFIPFEDIDAYLPTSGHKQWYKTCFNELRNSDILMCNSDFTKKNCLTIFPESQAITIYGGGEDSRVFNNEIQEIDLPKNFVLYCGGLEQRKNVKFLIDAYSKLDNDTLSNNPLVIVCGKHEELAYDLKTYASKYSNLDSVIIFLGYVSDPELRSYYKKCKLFVFPSLSEGLGLPILEAMSEGAPVLTSNSSSLPEFYGNVHGQFDPLDNDSLVSLLKKVLSSNEVLRKLRENSIRQSGKFTWKNTAKLFETGVKDINLRKTSLMTVCDSLETFILRTSIRKRTLEEMKSLAIAVKKQEIKTLYFDISNFYKSTAKTGIQRVVYSLMSNFNEQVHFRDIVYIAADEISQGYDVIEYCQGSWAVKGRAKPGVNDVYMSIDLTAEEVLRNSEILVNWKRLGVRLVFCVHDIGFELYPQFISNSRAVEILHDWLKFVVTYADVVVSVSASVIDEVKLWAKQHAIDDSLIKYEWFHLGADFSNFKETTRPMKNTSFTFISVSTIEPRKGYLELLNAFHEAVQAGMDASLVIVGRKGWKCEEVIEKIEGSKLYNKKLFWYSNCDDVTLRQLYAEADCFVFSSYYEGFGIPIVEAANYGLPLLLRNIPVFKEIAGKNAIYFDQFNGTTLVDQMIYCTQHKSELPDSSKLKVLTWKESTEMLCRKVSEAISSLDKIVLRALGMGRT